MITSERRAPRCNNQSNNYGKPFSGHSLAILIDRVDAVTVHDATHTANRYHDKLAFSRLALLMPHWAASLELRRKVMFITAIFEPLFSGKPFVLFPVLVLTKKIIFGDT